MKGALPFLHTERMSKMYRKGSQAKNTGISFTDLTDFRIPLDIFREYSVVMKGLNKDCQLAFLNAMGVDVINYKACLIDWNTFISIYCLLKLDSGTREEYIDFLIRVFDPYKKGLVPKQEFEFILNAIFKG